MLASVRAIIAPAHRPLQEIVGKMRARTVMKLPGRMGRLPQSGTRRGVFCIFALTTRIKSRAMRWRETRCNNNDPRMRQPSGESLARNCIRFAWFASLGDKPVSAHARSHRSPTCERHRNGSMPSSIEVGALSPEAHRALRLSRTLKRPMSTCRRQSFTLLTKARMEEIWQQPLQGRYRRFERQRRAPELELREIWSRWPLTAPASLQLPSLRHAVTALLRASDFPADDFWRKSPLAIVRTYKAVTLMPACLQKPNGRSQISRLASPLLPRPRDLFRRIGVTFKA